MSLGQRRKPSTPRLILVANVALVLAMTGCGDGDSDVADSVVTTEAAARTTETSTTTTTLPPIGIPFETDSVLSVPSISEIVGRGTITLAVAEEGGRVRLSVNGSAPVNDGETCQFCLAKLELGPGAVAAADALFANHPSQGVSAEMSGDLIGPMFPDSATVFIAAGREGAVLEKEGAGFRLVEGEAWLVTDRSLIDPDYDAAATTTSATTTTTAAPLPTYQEVVSGYPDTVSAPDWAAGEPAGYDPLALCATEASVVAAEPGKPWIVEISQETIVFGVPGATFEVMVGVEAWFPCWGMQLATQVPLEVAGSEVPAGSTLTVGADSDPSAFAPVALDTLPGTPTPVIARVGDLGFGLLIGDTARIEWLPPDGLVLVAVTK